MVATRWVSGSIGLALTCVPYFGCGGDKSSPAGDDGDTQKADAAVVDAGGGGELDGGSNGQGAKDAGSDASDPQSDDGGAPVQDSGTAPKCSEDISKADPALVQGLESAMQLWKWSKQKSGSTLTDITDECDKSTAYRVGPAVILNGTPHDYAACVIATQGFVELSAGRLSRPDGCAELSCSVRLGVIWNTATSGTVFVLDPNTGKPQGLAQAYLVLYSVAGDTYPHLIWSGNGSGNNGYLMDAQLGSSAVLACP